MVLYHQIDFRMALKLITNLVVKLLRKKLLTLEEMALIQRNLILMIITKLTKLNFLSKELIWPRREALGSESKIKRQKKKNFTLTFLKNSLKRN